MARTKSKTSNKKFGKVYITQGGNLFTDADLKRFEIPQSKQIDPIQFKHVKVLEPPFNTQKLMQWMDTSVSHNAAIRTKVQDSVGVGWELEQIEGFNGTDEQFDELTEFFNQVNEQEDIAIMSKKVFIDYEGSGNGYIEVARDIDNKISALYHIPAVSIRMHISKKKYIQKVGTKSVWFKLFGNEEAMDKNTGDFKQISNPDDIANEIIHLKMYTWRSIHYGAPEWLPAVFPMFGEQKEKEYNLNFFSSFGIPAYAVIFENSEMKDEDTDAIKKYFETEVKGNPHKTMVFALPKGGTVKFEALNVKAKDSSFKVFRRDNRDDILTAHRVPPYRAGIVVQGQLGGTVTAEIDRIYLNSVINPRQLEYEWLINNLIIKQGFAIEGWKLVFEDIAIDDRKSEADMHKLYASIGVYTPNQIREELGLEGYEGGDVYFIAGNVVPVDSAGQPLVEGEGKLTKIGEDKKAIELRKARKPVYIIAQDKLNVGFEKDLNKEWDREQKALLAFFTANKTLEKIRKDAMEANPKAFEKKDFYEFIEKAVSQEAMDDVEKLITGWEKKVKPESIEPILQEFALRAGELGGQNALKNLGLNLKFDLKNPKLKETLKKRGLKISGNIAKKTQADFQRLLVREFYEKGSSIAKARKEIKKLFKETYKNRSRTIAKTETGIAHEQTQNETYKKNKVDFKRWESVLDDITRGQDADSEFDHLGADQEQVGVNESFIATGEALEHPLDPFGSPGNIINCRCTSIPVLDEKIDPATAWLGL